MGSSLRQSANIFCKKPILRMTLFFVFIYSSFSVYSIDSTSHFLQKQGQGPAESIFLLAVKEKPKTSPEKASKKKSEKTPSSKNDENNLTSEKESEEKPTDTKDTKPKEKKDIDFGELDKQFQKALDNESVPGTRKTEEVSWGWQIIRTFFTLSILLLLLYGFYRLFQFRKNMPHPKTNAVKTLLEYPLKPGKNLTVIDLGSKLIVLGITSENIHPITEITDANQIEQMRIDCQKDSGMEKTDFFLELTRRIKDKVSGYTHESANVANEPPERDASLDRLRSLRRNRQFLKEDND